MRAHRSKRFAPSVRRLLSITEIRSHAVALGRGLDSDPESRCPCVRARVCRRAGHDGTADHEAAAGPRLTRSGKLAIDRVTRNDPVGDADTFGALRSVHGL